jgi:hypothetical protein
MACIPNLYCPFCQQEPPIKNTRLIDVDVERTSRAAVPAFELLDDRVHNFLAINAHRMAVTDKLLVIYLE